MTKLNLEFYLPKQMRPVKTKGGGERVKLMPIFSNLIFVKSTFQRVSEICGAYKDIYYLSEQIAGQRRALRVPDEQMQPFMEFIDGDYARLDCKTTKLKKGEKLVVKSGLFKGSTILFIAERGAAKKEYSLEINGRNVIFSEESFTQNILSRV